MDQPGFTYQPAVLRLGEFDLGGVLYHARYFHIYEETREALLRTHGLPYPSLVAQNIHLALIESSQQFKQPIFYGDELEVVLYTSNLSKSSVRCSYEIARLVNGSATVIHFATTTLVHVAKGENGRFRPTRFSSELLHIFETYRRS